MTIHRQEVITVRAAADPASIREALIQVPSDAHLTGLELGPAIVNGAGAVVRPGDALLIFERKNDDD